MTLTPKQARFVDEYPIDGNATRAAKTAGFSEKTAYSQGQRLLKHVEVKAAIEAAQKELAAAAKITREWIIAELVKNHKLARAGNPLLDRYGNPTGATMRQIQASNKALDQISELLGFKVQMVETTLSLYEHVTKRPRTGEEWNRQLKTATGSAAPEPEATNGSDQEIDAAGTDNSE